MNETSVGLDIAGALFRFMLIVVLIVVLMWIAVGLSAIWIAWHLWTTRAAKQGSPATQDAYNTNWFGVATVALAGVTLLLSLLSPELNPVLLAPALAAMATGIFALKVKDAMHPWTRKGIKTAIGAAVIAGLMLCFNVWINAPRAVTNEDFEHSGTATNIEEVWAKVECQGRLVDKASGISTGRANVHRIGECEIDLTSDGRSYFFEFASTTELTNAVIDGTFTAEKEMHDKLDLYVDGTVLILTADSGSHLALSNDGYDSWRVD